VLLEAGMSEPSLDLTETGVELFPARAVCRSHFIRTSVSHTGGDVYPYADLCPWCHAEKAEKERDEARPVLEAAKWLVREDKVGWHGHGENPDEFYCEGCLEHNLDSSLIQHKASCPINALILAVRTYDAARAAAKEGPEPTDQQRRDMARLDSGGETRGDR
jgi:hypothetical protein